MGREAKEIFGVDKLKAVADRGYCNSTEIKPCDDSAALAVPILVQLSAVSCRLQTEPVRILPLLLLQQVRDTRAQTARYFAGVITLPLCPKSNINYSFINVRPLYDASATTAMIGMPVGKIYF